jgi:hypothetical protein
MAILCPVLAPWQSAPGLFAPRRQHRVMTTLRDLRNATIPPSVGVDARRRAFMDGAPDVTLIVGVREGTSGRPTSTGQRDGFFRTSDFNRHQQV